MGPTADGVNSQAESTAQAVKSQAAPAAEAVKSQAQSLAPSSAEAVSQGLQPPAASGNVVDSAKAAGQQLQNQFKSSSDMVPSIGNVRSHAYLYDLQLARSEAMPIAAVSPLLQQLLLLLRLLLLLLLLP